jgi:hypothetical protein
MGGLFDPPKQKPVSVLPVSPTVEPAAAAVTAEPVAAAERRQRLQALARQRQGRAATIATSPRGLLATTNDAPARKSLLGE